MKLGLNNEAMQKANRNLILSILLEGGNISRIELAKRTNLQRATITNIINEFLEAGIVCEEEFQRESGRRMSALRLRVEQAIILSARLTREFFDIRAFLLDGTTIQERHIDITKDDDIEKTMRTVFATIDHLVQFHDNRRIIGMCVGLPGPYIRNEHNVAIVTGFEQLGRIDVQKMLEQRYDFPVFTEHDAKLSAFAEWKSLDAETQTKEDCLIAIQSIGIGIGSGMIVRGRIFHGAVGIAGEIGHMGINFNGSQNAGGNRGTFEKYASTGATRQYVLERMYEFPNTKLTESCSYDDIRQAYLEEDPLALAALDKLAWMLGYGLVNLIFVLNPNRIILSESYPDCPRFLGKVREGMSGMLYPQLTDSLQILYSGIKMDSTILGGYYLVTESLLKNNLLLERIKEIERLEKA